MALKGFVHLTHPDLPGAETLVADDDSVLAHYAVRGWVPSPEVPAHLDPDAPNTGAPAVVEPAAAAVEQPASAPEQPASPVKTTKTAATADEKTGA